MKRPLLLCMVISILVCAAFFCGRPGKDFAVADQADLTRRSSSAVATGAALYEKFCSMCHGPDGKGYLADDANALANQDFLVSASDEYIIQGILRGRPGTAMSAWGKDKGGIFTREDAEAILAFIRTWQKEPSVDVSGYTANGAPENGAKLFERWCAACHGKYGVGGKAIHLDNPVFQETASDGFIRYAIENGRRSTPMKAYRDILSAGDINDLVSYIRTLAAMDELVDTADADIAELEKNIRENGVLNPGNPPAQFSLRDNRFVAAEDVYAAYVAKKSLIIIDARPSSDYLRSHIKGAISIPFYDIENAAGLLPKDLWIITYCVCPHVLSGKALDALKAKGYKKVAILDEGFFFWKDKGYPSESLINSQLRD